MKRELDTLKVIGIAFLFTLLMSVVGCAPPDQVPRHVVIHIPQEHVIVKKITDQVQEYETDFSFGNFFFGGDAIKHAPVFKTKYFFITETDLLEVSMEDYYRYEAGQKFTPRNNRKNNYRQ